ncbi:unnamed protein product [marine sediment metagenome]|uniref:Uncharacterized protein n=1 Tax=marine sediment metagenome TaxID=412755 RepID=X1FW59_9ZZZZ
MYDKELVLEVLGQMQPSVIVLFNVGMFMYHKYHFADIRWF